MSSFLILSRRNRMPAGALHAAIEATLDEMTNNEDVITAYLVTQQLRSVYTSFEIEHSEVQARVHYVMPINYPGYQMNWENWNGVEARTYRPSLTISTPTTPANVFAPAPKVPQLPHSVKIEWD